MYLNKAIICGNLTRDPELKALPSGMKVTDFSVATNRVWKDKNGAKQESVDFHNIVVFGRQAEACAQYLKKGQQVMIEGRIQTRSWEGQDGKKSYRTEIVSEAVQFGPKSGNFNAGENETSKADIDADTGQKKPYKAKSKQPEPIGAPIEYPKDDINPDDIPF